MNRLLRLLVAGCVLILAGSARAQADASSDAPPDGPADAAATYQVGPRDVLHIAVFQEESLTGDYTVSEAGDIDFPLVGKVAVEGLSASAVDELLTGRLAADFLVQPQVQVRVASFASMPVRVLGAVKKPGVYPLTGPTSALELVAMAGGMSAEGVSEVRITRRGEDTPLVLRLDQAMADESRWMLRQGDSVFVPPPEVVYVSGEVSKPGAVPFSEGLTISQAIILAGGSKSTARLRKVWIKRGAEQIKVNLKRVLQGRDEDVVLLPDDTVLLSESVL